jgi:acylphosphatase
MTRYAVYFSGNVQGVGFRATTCDIAQGYEVAGYVQNLPDGRVLLEVEGQKEALDPFVAAIQQRMSGLVHQTQIDERAANGEFGQPRPGRVWIRR